MTAADVGETGLAKAAAEDLIQRGRVASAAFVSAVSDGMSSVEPIEVNRAGALQVALHARQLGS